MGINRKLLFLASVLIALAMLYPGVTQPVLSVTGSVEKSRIAELGIDLVTQQGAEGQKQMLTTISRLLGFDQIEGDLVVYSNTRSIWGTAEDLARNGYLEVGLLIILFSVFIPVFKLLLQTTSLFLAEAALRAPVLRLNAALSKWSMADVFVMGLLVSYLAGGAAKQGEEILALQANLGSGFYFFLGYCLFSIAAGKLLLAPDEAEVTS